MELYEKNYELVFEENFSGGLGHNKWEALNETVKAHGAKKNEDFVPTHVVTQESAKHDGCDMHYKPENVYVKDGHLVIKADRVGKGFSGGKCVCNGLVFAHGYVEAEVLFPEFQKGIWPKFGLTATTGNMYKTAYDIAAVHGEKGQNAFNMYLKWTDEVYETEHNINMLYGRPKRFFPEGDEKLTPGYHKVGLELTEDFVIFYLDGNECNRIDISPLPYHVFGKKILMKFTAELSAGLPNLDAPDADNDFPTEFKIRNIKLYQNSGDMLIKR